MLYNCAFLVYFLVENICCFLFLIFIFVCVYVCVCFHIHMNRGANVEAREHAGVDFLLLQSMFIDLNSGH